MKIAKIKPVPKYMARKIQKLDKQYHPEQTGHVRFYSYLTTNDKELVKVTVAVKNRYKKWYCKQVAIHGINSKLCFAKDIAFSNIAGYTVGWYAEGLGQYEKWYEDNQWGCCYDKYMDPYAPVVNMEYLYKFDKYKYSGFEYCKNTKILQHLRLYEQYPQMEYMLKLGFNKFAYSKQILRRVGKDKKFRKWLCNNAKDIQAKCYYVSAILLAYKNNMTIEQAQSYESAKKNLCTDKVYKDIRDLFKDNLSKYFDYCSKQNISNRLYLDYLTACQYLHLDMSLPQNAFPHDFHYWHDVRIDEYNTARALADAKKRQALYESFAKVADKYISLQKEGHTGYVAIIAKSPADLIKEGDTLNHCVGRMNYDQKMIREETLIFFIRHKDTPDVPFVTVEYSLSKHKVLQCYAKSNSKPDDNVYKYIHKNWLPYANRQLKKLCA